MMSYTEFCEKLADLCANKRVIENVTSDALFGAMRAWLLDTEGGEAFFENQTEGGISWADLWVLVQASTIYE